VTPSPATHTTDRLFRAACALRRTAAHAQDLVRRALMRRLARERERLAAALQEPTNNQRHRSRPQTRAGRAPPRRPQPGRAASSPLLSPGSARLRIRVRNARFGRDAQALLGRLDASVA
jgi:hypothetical protein